MKNQNSYLPRIASLLFAASASILATLPLRSANAASIIEVPLSSSLTSLNPPINGIELITKIWHNENSPRSHFEISLLRTADQTMEIGKYYAIIPAYDNNKKLPLIELNWADCSIAQIGIYKVVFGDRNNAILVIMSERVELPGKIPVLSAPRPQRFRLFRIEDSKQNALGSPSIRLNAQLDLTTERQICDADDVRAEMMKFAQEYISKISK